MFSDNVVETMAEEAQPLLVLVMKKYLAYFGIILGGPKNDDLAQLIFEIEILKIAGCFQK